MIGLCVAAVLAIAAFTASSASALPEWGKCVAQAGGKYKDGNCTEKTKGGSFEWKKGASLPNVAFTGHNVGSGGVLRTLAQSCINKESQEATHERVSHKACAENPETEPETEGSPIRVLCTAESNSGEQSGKSSVVNVHVIFTGCAAFGAIPCHSEGAKEGEVKVEPLKGALGYLNKSEKTVGVLLEPVTKHGLFAKFECGGILTTAVGVGNKKEGAFYAPENHGGYDGIISPITPVNQMSTSFEQVYTVNEETNENIPSHFEGKHIELLENYLINSEGGTTFWDPASEEITNVNTPTEAGEIKG